MKKRIGILVFTLLALIAEWLPFGAVLQFASPTEDGRIERIRETYSYFDLTPFGYANFGPFLTAMLTCLLLTAAIWLLWTGSGLAMYVVRGLSGAAVVLSLLPLMFGISFYSITGGVITLLLFAVAVLSYQKTNQS